jgi:O-antigen/teichoic acid export membrane protein
VLYKPNIHTVGVNIIKVPGKLKSIATLVFGTATNQLIGIVATFILARVYSPDAFGVFGSSLAICTIFSVMAALKFDLTVIFPKTAVAAKLCSFISLLTICIFSIFMTGLLFAINAIDLIFLDFPLIHYIVLTSLIAFEQIAINWLIRNKSFKIITLITVLKGLVIAFLQYFLKEADGGLWYGHVCGYVFVGILYLIIMSQPLIEGARAFSKLRLFYFVKKYKKFPTFSLPAGVLNTFGNQIPILLIRSLFGEQYAGYYLLVKKIILAPVDLISTNINKVLSQEVSHNIAHHKPYLDGVIYYIKFSSVLSAAAIVSTLVFLYVDGIILLMGEAWREAEVLAFVMLPLAAISFVSRSVSRFAVYGKNEWGLYYQFIFATFSVTSFYTASLFTENFVVVIATYTIVICIIYLTQIMLVLRISKQHMKNIGYG